MFEKIQKLLDRIESRIALWTIVQGSGIVTGGLISGWFASAEAWVGSYGRLGWWFAFLIGAFITALVLVGFAALRYLWYRAAIMRTWEERAETVNPLQSTFRDQRIFLQDVLDPLGRRIRRKRFVDCELIGPANLFIPSGQITSVTFSACDVVVVQPNRRTSTLILFDQNEVYGGSISKCTLFILPAMVPVFHQMGTSFLSLTGVSEVDSQPSPSPAPETPP